MRPLMMLRNGFRRDSLCFGLLICIPILLILIGLSVLQYLKISNEAIVQKTADIVARECVEDKLERIDSMSHESLPESVTPEEAYQALIKQRLSQKLSLDRKNYELNEDKRLKDRLIFDYNGLTSKYESVCAHTIKGVSTINQYPEYPNGCEFVALAILLQYYNIDVSVDDIIERSPMGRAPYVEDGVLYGGDPNVEYLGDPRSYNGWGIWDRGLRSVAESFKRDAINGTGMPFEEIVKLILRDRPVIVWTSIDLGDPYILMEWTYPPTCETIVWKNYNHAVVVIGYTDDSVIVSDPIDGSVRSFDRSRFIAVYDYMGRRAIYY